MWAAVLDAARVTLAPARRLRAERSYVIPRLRKVFLTGPILTAMLLNRLASFWRSENDTPLPSFHLKWHAESKSLAACAARSSAATALLPPLIQARRSSMKTPHCTRGSTLCIWTQNTVMIAETAITDHGHPCKSPFVRCTGNRAVAPAQFNQVRIQA